MRPYPDGAKKNYRAPMTHRTDYPLPDDSQFSAFIRMSEKTSEFNSGDESEYLILPL